MTVIVSAVVRAVQAYFPPPSVVVQFRLLREGEVTAEAKTVYVYRDIDSLSQLALALEARGGEFTVARRVDLATLYAQGDWLVIGNDNTLPRKVRAVYMKLDGGVVTLDLTAGEGAAQGDPAAVEARVRVDRVAASREVVMLERQADGAWRIAGYGPTPGGFGEIELRVVGGDVYALAVDDYGVPFVADLAVQVGQRIRPSVFGGWLYEITEPGVLPPTEPEWWPAQGDNASRPLGTARAIAVRYYRPLAHGPLPRELIE